MADLHLDEARRAILGLELVYPAVASELAALRTKTDAAVKAQGIDPASFAEAAYVLGVVFRALYERHGPAATLMHRAAQDENGNRLREVILWALGIDPAT